MAIQKTTPPPNSEPELIVAVQETTPPPNLEPEVVIEYWRNDDGDGDRDNADTDGI